MELIKCTICDEVFESEDEFKSHWDDYHQEECPYMEDAMEHVDDDDVSGLELMAMWLLNVIS